MLPKKQSKRVIIGCLGAVFGVRGYLKVNSYTTPATNILNYPNWQVQHQGQWLPLPIDQLKKQGDNIILKIKNIDDRDIAKTYTNDLLAIARDELPEPDDNEYYWSDLVGLTVKTLDGHTLGTIIEMRDTGANDVMIVEGEKRHLVPFIKNILIAVNLDEQTVIVDWDNDF